MTDSLAAAYLIVGDDPYLTIAAIERVISGIPELSVAHYGPEDEISQVLEALNTPAMFGDIRVVVIRDADDLSAQALRQIEQYLEAPSADSSLVLTSKKPLLKIATAVKKVGRVIEASRGKRSDVFSWLRDEIKARGLKPAGDAHSALVEAVGEERLALSQALDELLLLLGEGARLTAQDVRKQFKERSDVRVFGFVDAVAGRESGQALEVLHRLVRMGESPQALFWLLARHFRMLLVAGSTNPKEVAKQLGLPSWRAEKLSRQSRNYTPDELANAFVLLAEADRRMKKSEEPELLTLERTVVAIAGHR